MLLRSSEYTGQALEHDRHPGSDAQILARVAVAVAQDHECEQHPERHVGSVKKSRAIDSIRRQEQGDWMDAREITLLIEAHRDGDANAYDRAVELLYGELRGLAHHQLARFHGQATLQTTAVVNEAYLKLKESSKSAIDRRHFLGIAAKAMRHVVIDYARRRSAAKRGGDLVRVEFDEADAAVEAQAEQLLLIDESLTALAAKSERLVRVFECKFFAGLDDDETAATLDLSKRTAQRDWMKARALLADYLSRMG